MGLRRLLSFYQGRVEKRETEKTKNIRKKRPSTVLSILKSLQVLQKACIKILTFAIYTFLIFLLHTLSLSAAK